LACLRGTGGVDFALKAKDLCLAGSLKKGFPILANEKFEMKRDYKYKNYLILRTRLRRNVANSKMKKIFLPLLLQKFYKMKNCT